MENASAGRDSLSAKYNRFSRLDEGAALTETESVRASESAVKEREREAWRQKQALASRVRARWARGELSDADYARLAREAGVSAREVLAELKERVAQRRPIIDAAAVSRGDVAAVSDAAGLGAGGEGGADAALSAAEERKAVATALLQRAHHAEALEGLSAALAGLGGLPEPAASSARARGLRAACLANSALAHLGLKDWARAEAACDAVLALEPRNIKALMRRATARRALGRLDGARLDLEAAAQLEPANAPLRALRAEVDAALRGPDAPRAPPAPDPLARSYCYLDLEVDGCAAGRLVLQLFDELAPLTCANFYALCKGWAPLPSQAAQAAQAAGGEGAPAAAPALLSYAGSAIHRVAKGLAVQGGDILAGDGSGGASIYGGLFADETFAVPHARPGVLSMANTGEPHSNGCQFFITTNAAPHLDGKHVGFGRLLAGAALLHRLEALPLRPGTEAPAVPVRISGCGVLDADAVSLDAADDDGVSSYGADALLVAAARGDSAMVAVLIKAGAELDARVAVPLGFRGEESVEGLAAAAARAAASGQSAERTALHVAAANGRGAVLRGLLRAKADVNAFDSTGACALHLAVREARCADCARALLEGGADAAALTSSGSTAAHIAAERGDEACLAALLGAGAPDGGGAQAQGEEEEALRSRRLALVSAATPEPADEPRAADGADGGERAPAGAAAGSEPAALAAGTGGVTALHVAAAADEAGCVRLLLAHGARPQARAGGELSAVHIAAARGALRALGALLAHGGPGGARALADADGGKSGKRPLHCAAEHGAAEAVRTLTTSGADLTARDARGSSALHWAALGGHAAAVRALLELGADVAAQASRGATALHVGSEHGSAPVVRALLEAGADANASARGGVTPLHAAAKSGSAECAQALLSAGAQPDSEMEIRVDSAGHRSTTRKRALHVAAEGGHAGVLRALLGSGADVHALAQIEAAESTSSTSALFSARRGAHAEAVALLEAAGALEVSRVDL